MCHQDPVSQTLFSLLCFPLPWLPSEAGSLHEATLFSGNSKLNLIFRVSNTSGGKARFQQRS